VIPLRQRPVQIRLAFLERKYFWISFSRSGDSPEATAVLEQARKTHPDICSRRLVQLDGRMFRDNADRRPNTSPGHLLDDAVNDRGLAMTSAFSNMVIFGRCLAHIDHLGSHEEVLSRVVEAERSLLPRAADCASTIAKAGYTQACFVGSGPLRAVARERTLKLLELTAGTAMTTSESTLGLRHGPLAALDHDSLSSVPFPAIAGAAL
jgi:tagatose-6-phosphate ketose/aldose isomerase